MGYIRLPRQRLWSAGASKARPRFGSLGAVLRHSQSAATVELAGLIQGFKAWRLRHQVPIMWPNRA